VSMLDLSRHRVQGRRGSDDWGRLLGLRGHVSKAGRAPAAPYGAGGRCAVPTSGPSTFRRAVTPVPEHEGMDVDRSRRFPTRRLGPLARVAITCGKSYRPDYRRIFCLEPHCRRRFFRRTPAAPRSPNQESHGIALVPHPVSQGTPASAA
jgi:hypothetical protein